jgi:hypothetical protein
LPTLTELAGALGLTSGHDLETRDLPAGETTAEAGTAANPAVHPSATASS